MTTRLMSAPVCKMQYLCVSSILNARCTPSINENLNIKHKIYIYIETEMNLKLNKYFI